MRGVNFVAKTGKWRNMIYIDGTIYCLGSFPTEGQACIEMAIFKDEWFGKDMWWPYNYSMCNHSLYKTWQHMNGRCHDIKHHRFYLYGGRGIYVDYRWRKSFYKFIQDVGTKPTKNHSLDRIDNNGNYCKENTKWSTQEEQCRNTQKQQNKNNGTFLCKKTNRYKAVIGVNKKQIKLGTFKNLEDAIAARKAGEEKYWN